MNAQPTSTGQAAAALGVLAAQVSINVGAALGKGLFAQVGPEGVAALRTSLAAIILLLVARPWTLRLSGSQLRALGLYGAALGGMNVLIYWAIARIPIGIAVAIEICGPLAVVLLSSRTAKDFAWLALALVGLALLVPWPGRGAGLDPLGVLCALGAASCWALYILFGKRAAEVRGAKAVALGMVAACGVTAPLGLAAAGVQLLAPSVLALGLVVAVLSSALPYFIEMKALERLTSRTFGLVTSSAPAIAALTGVVLLGEHLSALQWGAILILVTASAGSSATPGAPDQSPNP